MKASKTSNFVIGSFNNYKYPSDLDKDVKKLFTVLSGRVRFGDGSGSGENISGQFVEFTSHTSANTEFTVAHTLGAVPVGYIIVSQDKAGSLYQMADTGTAWTSSAVYLKCSVSSVKFRVFLLK